MTRPTTMCSLLLAAVLGGLFGEALGCECGNRFTVGQQFADAPIVFVGRVESISDRWSALAKMWLRIRRIFDEHAQPEINEHRYCTDYGMEVTFAVIQSWKGVSAPDITLLTGRGGGDCGLQFETGKTYVVFAYPRSGDGCQTNICTRTGELPFAAEDLAFLRQRESRRFR